MTSAQGLVFDARRTSRFDRVAILSARLFDTASYLSDFSPDYVLRNTQIVQSVASALIAPISSLNFAHLTRNFLIIRLIARY